MREVNVGIVGAGYIGREHARSLRLVRPLFDGRLNLVGIADSNLKAAEGAARDFEIEYATDDVERLLADPRINTIMSCVPSKFHPDILSRAAAKGKALFIEKPFARTYEEVQEMARVLAAHPVPCQTGFVLRYTPVYHVLRDRIAAARKKSKLMTVLLRDDQAFPIRGHMHFTAWRGDRDITGGGVLIEHGIHDIDIIEWFFGPIKTVRAQSRNFAGHPGVEDFISVEFTFADGVVGNMVHLWHDIEPHQAIRHFEIFFRDTFLTLDSYAMGGMTIRDNEADHVWNREDLYREVQKLKFYPELAKREDIVAMGDYYAIQDYAFVKNLLDDKPLAPTFKDGMRAYGIVQACYWSAAHAGEPVDLERFLVL